MSRGCWAGPVVLVSAVALMAETPWGKPGTILRFTATTVNVSGAPDSIRIDLFRWSTDAERNKLVDAWNLKPGAVGRGAAGRGARGGAGRAGRGAPVTPEPVAGNDDPPARASGRGRGGAAAPASVSPEGNFATGLTEAVTVGYLWSSEIAGYGIRYAGEIGDMDGPSRIILITDRRLGDVNDLWKPGTSAVPSNYNFSVIELRVDGKGAGEGKISLAGKVQLDFSAGIVTLADYAALPVALTDVKTQWKAP